MMGTLSLGSTAVIGGNIPGKDQTLSILSGITPSMLTLVFQKSNHGRVPISDKR
jgi:hypothetical protein